MDNIHVTFYHSAQVSPFMRAAETFNQAHPDVRIIVSIVPIRSCVEDACIFATHIVGKRDVTPYYFYNITTQTVQEYEQRLQREYELYGDFTKVMRALKKTRCCVQ